MRVDLERWGGPGRGSFPLAWFRPDPRAPLVPVWRSSVLLVLLGGALCAWFFARIEEDPILLLLLGLCSVATGMLRVVRAALRSLGDERCVSLFREGVVLRDTKASREHISWRELKEVTIVVGEDGSEILLITRRAGSSDEGELQVELLHMPIQAEAFRGLLLECARRDGLGVALKIEDQLERLGVKAGLPRGAQA